MRTWVALGVVVLAQSAFAQSAGALTATVSLAQHDYAKDADVEVAVALTNGTSHAVDVAAQALETAVLLLDVQDASGKHVATVSPPVPNASIVHFASGQQRVVKVRLGVFSPPLRSGDYTVRPAPSLATGAAATFHIR